MGIRFGMWHAGIVLACYNVDWIQVVQGSVSCEHGTEPSGYTRDEEFQCLSYVYKLDLTLTVNVSE